MRTETDPDVAWVAALSGRPLGAAEKAVSEGARDRRLFAHLAREHRREGRDSYIEIDAPLELYALVRLLRPRHVVEVGVSSGVSSAYLLRAMDANGVGTLHSIDLPSHPGRGTSATTRNSWTLPAHRSTGWAVPGGLWKRWDLRLGDKAEVLPRLVPELDAIDLVVYDVPHDDAVIWREFRSIDPKVGSGGVAIVDHGPGGDLCGALRRWARRRGAHPERRTGLGLYGMRADGRAE